MPLMNCQDCGNEHSDAATACPKCGKPNIKEATLPKDPPQQQYNWDDGGSVMYGGTSTTAGTVERSQLVVGVMVGLGLGGCGAAIALAMMPIAMFIGKRNDMPPALKGMVYGSIPWICFWILAFFAGAFK